MRISARWVARSEIPGSNVMHISNMENHCQVVLFCKGTYECQSPPEPSPTLKANLSFNFAKTMSPCF